MNMKTIKQIISKVFFKNEPAKGAFFGLTGIFALPWLLFTLCIGASLNYEASVYDVAIAIILYIGSLLSVKFCILRANVLSNLIPKDASFIQRNYLWLFPLLLLVSCIVLDCFDLEELMSFAIFLWLFIEVMIFPGARILEWLAMFILWLTGFIGFCMLFAYSVLPFVIIIDKLSDSPPPIVQSHDYPVLTPLCEWLHISGAGWFWLAFMSFLCILLVYLIQAKIIARTAKVPLRSLFCKRTLCLLGSCVAIYAVSLPFALYEESCYHRAIGKLEKQFGKPLAVSEIEKIYYDGSQPDEAFWAELRKATTPLVKGWQWKSKLFLKNEYYSFSPFDRNLFWIEWEDEPYSKWREFCLKNPDNDTVNALLERSIPPAERDYAERPLLYCKWIFDDWKVLRDCSYLLLWQLRFAVEERDKVAIKHIFDRLEKICTFVKRDEFSRFYFVESLRLTAMIRVIEGGLADDAWLDRQEERLASLEQELGELGRREMHRQAAIFTSMAYSLAHHLDKEEHDHAGAELSRLRWFFPQAWWRVAVKANAGARRFLCDSYTQMEDSDVSFGLSWHDYDVRRSSRCFKSMLVSLRSCKVLLAAERIRRRTGSFPPQMADLPQDPFTGKPLLYFVGPCEIEAKYIMSAKPEECVDDINPDYGCACGCDSSGGCLCKGSSDKTMIDIRNEKRIVNAVQVVSPGPEPERKYDDIHFFIRCQ